jgi:hypothetical protein
VVETKKMSGNYESNHYKHTRRTVLALATVENKRPVVDLDNLYIADFKNKTLFGAAEAAGVSLLDLARELSADKRLFPEAYVRITMLTNGFSEMRFRSARAKDGRNIYLPDDIAFDVVRRSMEPDVKDMLNPIRTSRGARPAPVVQPVEIVAPAPAEVETEVEAEAAAPTPAVKSKARGRAKKAIEAAEALEPLAEASFGFDAEPAPAAKSEESSFGFGEEPAEAGIDQDGTMKKLAKMLA